MKKIILSLVFVAVTGVTLISANQTKESKATIKQLSCAGDCVALSKEGALWEVGEDGDRSAGGELVEAFMRYYQACLSINC